MNDDAVSFLKCNVESNAKTKMISKSIIEVFLLNDEKTSKFPNIRTAYKKDTI